MAESSRIKSLSVSRIFLSGMPSQVFTASLEHLEKLELINCNISSPSLSGLMLRLSREDSSMRELNLTNTQIGELNPTILAECSSRLEKICLSNVTEKQTLEIFRVLSKTKASRLKTLVLDGVNDYDAWYTEGSYFSSALTKLERFSINFRRYQESTRERATSIPPFLKFLFLQQRLDEISIFNKNISLLCHPGNSTTDFTKYLKRIFFIEGKTTLNCDTFAASISSLSSLSLVRTEMSPAQLSAIFEVLSKDKLSLKYLDLSENDLITVNGNQLGKEMKRFFR